MIRFIFIVSKLRQSTYIPENSIVIKHSLTVAKFPTKNQNPVITYDFNVTSNYKEFYAFAISWYVMAPDVLHLDIMSVNLNKNEVTIFFEGFKTLWKDVVVENISGSQLSLSYSNSIISSPCHAIDLIDTSWYQNVSVHVRDEHMKHIKDTIEMNNVTIWNRKCSIKR